MLAFISAHIPLTFFSRQQTASKMKFASALAVGLAMGPCASAKTVSVYVVPVKVQRLTANDQPYTTYDGAFFA